MHETEHEEPYLTIFLSGAGSPLGKQIDEFIETKLGHEVVAADKGAMSIAELEQETEECSFAILLLTAADARSRENLVHEIGYCQGTFGYQNVLVLRQEGIEAFAHLPGILYEVFSGENIKTTFPRIRAEIDAAMERFSSEEEAEED